jgi:hypothetical protein
MGALGDARESKTVQLERNARSLFRNQDKTLANRSARLYDPQNAADDAGHALRAINILMVFPAVPSTPNPGDHELLTSSTVLPCQDGVPGWDYRWNRAIDIEDRVRQLF